MKIDGGFSGGGPPALGQGSGIGGGIIQALRGIVGGGGTPPRPNGSGGGVGGIPGQ